MNDSVTYDLSIEQLDSYSMEEPMVLLVPMNPAFFPLGDPVKLIADVAACLPDVDPSDIDDCRPGFIWCEPHKVPPVQRTTLNDVYGRTLSPALAKECPLVASVWVAVTSINDGRANRACGVFPAGAIRSGEEGDIFFPRVSHGIEATKRSRPAVNPDYFVDTDFGGPED